MGWLWQSLILITMVWKMFLSAHQRIKKNILFIQQANGTFIPSNQYSLQNDSAYEDVAACFADVNNDGNIDLIVASGGNESFGKNPLLSPRLYLNDGKGNFSKSDAFESLFVNASCRSLRF